MTQEQLEQIARAWRRALAARDVLLLGAAALAVAGLSIFWLTPILALLLAGSVFAIGFVARAVTSTWRTLDGARLAQHLDRTYPELEESSALWLRPPEKMSMLERLQRQRLDRAADGLRKDEGRRFAAPPSEITRRPLIGLAIGLAIFAALFAWQGLRPQRATVEKPALPASASETGRIVPASIPPRIVRAELLITPPAYTGRAPRRVEGLEAEIEEGANVGWLLEFDQPIKQTQLLFGQGQNLPLERNAGNEWQAQRQISETAFYSMAAQLPPGVSWNPAELYSLRVLKDKAPSLVIMQPVETRTEIAPPAQVVTIAVRASDDFEVTDAHLVATVAKGTGEGVKFREQKIPFAEKAQLENGHRFSITLDLIELGLEPGDELYFHVESTDNREPTANRARSETRFVMLKGPEQSVSTPGLGVTGINLVPQYFRSQRQIIIDTEKLIAERPELAETEFRERANNLGIDQQLLRQRYGQFLGEEAEAGEPQEEHFPGDGHDHGETAEAPRTQEEISAQFGHQHDSQDAATLFDRETKGTMRQALAAMWEAERLLRMAQPAEALLPENRALEILKELQQADRAYVQRVGFEAAPLKIEERRLRGNVSEVPARKIAEPVTLPSDEAMADVRELLRLTSSTGTGEIELLRRVEVLLTKAATEKPEIFLRGLEALRRRLAHEALSKEDASELERALLQLLPPAQARPIRPGEPSAELAERYFKNLAESVP